MILLRDEIIKHLLENYSSSEPLRFEITSREEIRCIASDSAYEIPSDSECDEILENLPNLSDYDEIYGRLQRLEFVKNKTFK